MRQFDRFYLLIFHIIDKLTEDANTMVNEQDNKSKCIRTILLDFVKVNGIINNYTDIPATERLERFFGYFAYNDKLYFLFIPCSFCTANRLFCCPIGFLILCVYSRSRMGKGNYIPDREIGIF